MTKKKDYLVIGAEGNSCWIFVCYGRKVEKAISMRKSGHEIVEMIKAQKGSDAEIEIKLNLAYSSIKFFGVYTLRVKCASKNYIVLKNSFEHIWANCNSLRVKQIKSDKLWSRISFDSQEELKNLYPLFLQLYDQAFLMVNVELFSCCSRFMQCSDERICVQPNKRLTLGCIYGKHLKNGKVFYGKNCNVLSGNISI